MTKKPKKKFPGPNPLYPTQSVLRKLAAVLSAYLAQHRTRDIVDDAIDGVLATRLIDDPELTAWLKAMRERGLLEERKA